MSESASISRKTAGMVLPHYKPFSTYLKKISAFINKHSSFVITTHAGADADGVGSEIALWYLLKAMKKKVIIVNNEAVPDFIHFVLPEEPSFQVYNYKECQLEENCDELKDFVKSSAVIIVDSSDPKRSGKVSEFLFEHKPDWISIDHHIVEKHKNYFSDSTYSATCEFIWDIYKFLGQKINYTSALALYTGLIADTGNFRYPKTSFRTHLAAGDLLRHPIPSDEVYRAVFEAFPADRLKLLRRLLKDALIDEKSGIVAAFVKPGHLKGLNLGNSPTEGIVNLLLGVQGIHISAVMTQTSEGHLKASLRSKGDYNVQRVAARFGGGGHKNASGLKVEKRFGPASREIILALKKEVLEHREVNK